MSKLDHALAWARRGYKVFPLQVNGKKPSIPDFGLKATTDEATIHTWWRDPVTGFVTDNNIGVLTTDQVVVDIDVKDGKPGLDNYRALGGHFETLVVQTPTGGYHCYFEGLDSANTYPAKGVDIRSHNGYVLAPGSTINGVPYTVLVDRPVGWIPPNIDATLRRPNEKVRTEYTGEQDTLSSITLAEEWLKFDAPVAVEGQNGDHTTYSVACKLVRDFALTDETACELLLREWNERCEPPWDRDELLLKVENAAAYGAGAMGAALPEAFFGPDIFIPDTAGQALQKSSLDFGNASDVIFIPPRPWLVPRLLMRKAITVLVAQGGAGKTTLALALAAHGAVGRDFGQYKFNAPFKSVIYCAEEDKDEMSRRLYALCVEYKFDWPAVRDGIMLISSDDVELSIANTVQRQVVMNLEHVTWLKSILERPDVGLFIADPFVELHGCDEGDNPQMKSVMAIIRRIARDADVSILIPHHTPKSGSEAGNADAARGAGAIVNSARIALTLFSATDRDREKFCIAEEDKHKYVRMDDAKMNLALASSNATWFKKNGVRIPNGDEVGVLKLHEMENGEDAQRQFIAITCAEVLTSSATASISMQSAIAALRAADTLYERMNVNTLRARVEKLLGHGVALDIGIVKCKRIGSEKSEKVLIVLE